MKNKSFLIVCLIILIVIMTLFIKDTYSRYAGNSQASAAITVAKWAFETDNAQNTINVSLSETYDPTTLVNGKIAPGTRGSFAIVLKNPTSETSVDFSVSIGSISNVPANLKFYKDFHFDTIVEEEKDTKNNIEIDKDINYKKIIRDKDKQNNYKTYKNLQ